MSNDLKQLKVGDTAWIIGHLYTGRNEKSPVPMIQCTVVKIGRKYISVKSERAHGWRQGEDHFEIESGREKGHHSLQQSRARKLYIDIHHYADEQARMKAEDQLTKCFRRGYGSVLHSAVTTADILAAAKLLRINIDLEGKKE